jgi:hypothetical protein
MLRGEQEEDRKEVRARLNEKKMKQHTRERRERERKGYNALFINNRFIFK